MIFSTLKTKSAAIKKQQQKWEQEEGERQERDHLKIGCKKREGRKEKEEGEGVFECVLVGSAHLSRKEKKKKIIWSRKRRRKKKGDSQEDEKELFMNQTFSHREAEERQEVLTTLQEWSIWKQFFEPNQTKKKTSLLFYSIVYKQHER